MNNLEVEDCMDIPLTFHMKNIILIISYQRVRNQILHLICENYQVNMLRDTTRLCMTTLYFL